MINAMLRWRLCLGVDHVRGIAVKESLLPVLLGSFVLPLPEAALPLLA
jgi:hypothetical protein